ncbi:hypothetical protein C8R47DRAFT_1276985 [Mycena vitilis]|nr:hypothetical protein C8R47DRAFT_1276985 [Mycena vitilis]
MPAPQWTSPPQREFLVKKLPLYLIAKSNAKKVSLTRFWTALFIEYFQLFSEEERLGLIARVPGGPPFTAEEVALLAKGINKTKERLKGWMRYRDSRPRVGPAGHKNGRSLFKLLTIKGAKRPYRIIETYQKMFPQKIQAELDARGYRKLNEEFETERAPLTSYFVTTVGAPTDGAAPNADPAAAVEVRLMTEAEIEAEEQRREDVIVARIRKNASLRMSMRRRTTVDLFDGESDEVKRTVQEETARVNRERAVGQADADDDEKRTPQEYQNAIDQLGTVLGLVSDAIMLETGFVGMFMLGGPSPRRGGGISINNFCFGKTPLGRDFQASHPNFDELKSQFGGFVKRVFPHEIRDERALPVEPAVAAPTIVEDIPLDGLIPLESVPDDDSLSMPPPATVPVKVTAPKRMRRKTAKAASASAAAPTAPATPSAAAATPAQPHPSPFSATVASPASSPSSPSPPSPASPAPGAGPALRLPDDFDDVMSGLGFDYDEDAASSTYGFGAGFSSDDDDPTLPFPRAFAPSFSSTVDTRPDDEMDGERALTPGMEEASVSRPVARPMHHGASFEQNRNVGGSPGRGGSFLPPNDYRPSLLFQAFAKPLPPPRSTPLPALWSAPLRNPDPSSDSNSYPVVRDCSSAFTAFALSQRASASSVPPSLPVPPSTPFSFPAPSTPFSFPSSTSSAVSAPPSLPAPPSTPFSFPAPSTPISFPSDVSASSVAAPTASATPTTGFRNRPPAGAASALAAFKATVASATAEVEQQQRAPPAPRAFLPQYIQSRPPANVPKGHPLAPAQQKAAPAPARRGRPRKQADENIAADAVQPEEPAPAPATMSAAARTETARINREAAALRKQSLALRKLEKVRDDKAAAEEMAAERLRASRENPAGGAPLFVTGARPKRAMNAGKNADGTPIIRPKKRGAEVMAEEDARIEAAFAAQKTGAVGAAGKGKKAAAATAPRAGARAGTRAASAAVAAAKPAAKLRGAIGRREAAASKGGKAGQRRHEGGVLHGHQRRDGCAYTARYAVCRAQCAAGRQRPAGSGGIEGGKAGQQRREERAWSASKDEAGAQTPFDALEGVRSALQGANGRREVAGSRGGKRGQRRREKRSGLTDLEDLSLEFPVYDDTPRGITLATTYAHLKRFFFSGGILFPKSDFLVRHPGIETLFLESEQAFRGTDGSHFPALRILSVDGESLLSSPAVLKSPLTHLRLRYFDLDSSEALDAVRAVARTLACLELEFVLLEESFDVVHFVERMLPLLGAASALDELGLLHSPCHAPSIAAIGLLKALLPALDSDAPMRALRIGTTGSYLRSTDDTLPPDVQYNLGPLPSRLRYLGWDIAPAESFVYVIERRGDRNCVGSTLTREVSEDWAAQSVLWYVDMKN